MIPPKVGQVWASSNQASRFQIIAVFPNGSVSISTTALPSGSTGMLYDYTAEQWAGMVENSNLQLVEDAEEQPAQ